MAICDECRCTTSIKIDGWKNGKKVGRCANCQNRARRKTRRVPQGQLWQSRETPEVFR